MLRNSLSRWFQQFSAQIERQCSEVLLLFTILYLVVTFFHGGRRFWYDELFTFYMARLPDLQTIWAALKDGADHNPPLLYVATKISHSLFGYGEFATRVPAMLGYLLMCFSLLIFVGRRSGRTYGMAAMVFPLMTGAYSYATEARSYGMVLGFGAAAVVAYQFAADRVHRRLSVASLAIFLSAALLTHSYAVLLLVPFGMSEAVRTWTQRRGDLPVIAAVILPALSILIYLPILATLNSYVLNTVVFQPSFASLMACYKTLFDPVVWPILIALAMIAISALSLGAEPQPLTRSEFPLPFHEVVLTAFLLAVPVLAMIVAALVTRVFMNRYGLSAVIGASILLCSSASWVARRSRTVGAALFLLFLACFVVQSALWFRDVLNGRQQYSMRAKPPLQLSKLQNDLPLVISNGLLFLQVDHYESPEIVSRLHFLTDRASALSYMGTDMFDKHYPVIRKWFPIRGKTSSYSDFMKANKRFLMIGSYEQVLEWLPHKLVADGVHLRYVGEYAWGVGDVIVLEAQQDGSSSSGNGTPP